MKIPLFGVHREVLELSTFERPLLWTLEDILELSTLERPKAVVRFLPVLLPGDANLASDCSFCNPVTTTPSGVFLTENLIAFDCELILLINISHKHANEAPSSQVMMFF